MGQSALTVGELMVTVPEGTCLAALTVPEPSETTEVTAKIPTSAIFLSMTFSP